MPVTPPVIGTDIRQWGRELNLFLSRNLGKLFFKSSGDIPAETEFFCGIIKMDIRLFLPAAHFAR